MKDAYEKAFLGETTKVLVEDPSGKHPGYAAGHAPNYIKVYFEADAEGLDIVGNRIGVKLTGFIQDGMSGVKL
jgi:tRNA A37 methylthiotransferase MiaB